MDFSIFAFFQYHVIFCFQVVFQQHQIEEKERLIQALQAQVAKYEQAETSVSTSVETCNAATQTERVTWVKYVVCHVTFWPCANFITYIVKYNNTHMFKFVCYQLIICWHYIHIKLMSSLPIVIFLEDNILKHAWCTCVWFCECCHIFK